MAGSRFLSGRILAKSLLPEPKTSLKCSLGALVSGNKLRFSKKKFTFSPLFRGGAFGSSSLPTIAAAVMGRASAKHAPQAPRVGAHDVILTGLDEEGDSTDDEMPPLEPLEGAAQLGVVWLRGHGKDGCDPATSAKLALQLGATQLGQLQRGCIRMLWRVGGEFGNAISVGGSTCVR